MSLLAIRVPVSHEVAVAIMIIGGVGLVIAVIVVAMGTREDAQFREEVKRDLRTYGIGFLAVLLFSVLAMVSMGITKW